jgi:hypothetical protein
MNVYSTLFDFVSSILNGEMPVRKLKNFFFKLHFYTFRYSLICSNAHHVFVYISNDPRFLCA